MYGHQIDDAGFAFGKSCARAGAMDTIERCFFVAAATSVFVLIVVGLMSP